MWFPWEEPDLPRQPLADSRRVPREHAEGPTGARGDAGACRPRGWGRGDGLFTCLPAVCVWVLKCVQTDERCVCGTYL